MRTNLTLEVLQELLNSLEETPEQKKVREIIERIQNAHSISVQPTKWLKETDVMYLFDKYHAFEELRNKHFTLICTPDAEQKAHEIVNRCRNRKRL